MRHRAFATLACLLAAFVMAIGPVTADAATQTLFGSAVPRVKAYAVGQPVTIGVKFATATAGQVTGIRFYKGAGNNGTHVAALYSSTGVQLARAVYGSETASGWQSVSFSAPVAAAAGTTLTAAVHAPRGHYAHQATYAVCGYWGPITSFDPAAPGNVWRDNFFDDGSAVAPA